MVRPNVDLPQSVHGQLKDVVAASDLSIEEVYYEAIMRGLPALLDDLDAQDALDPDPVVASALAGVGAIDGNRRSPTAAGSTTLPADRAEGDHDGDHTVVDRP